MANATTGKGRCITCNKEKSAVRCEGCQQLFCFDHLIEHRQEISSQLDEIEINRDIFRQTLTELKNNPEHHVLVKQIDQWEKESIQRIQQKAQQCRQMLLQHTTISLHQLEVKLEKLTDQLRHTREENDVNEIDIHQLNEKLTLLSKELHQPSNVSIQCDSSPLVNNITVIIPTRQLLSLSSIQISRKWKQLAITVAGGNGQGEQLNQLYRPCGIDVDHARQCIYIAECNNHRIVEWKYNANNGKVVAGGNGKGDRMNQLYGPADVVLGRDNGSLIICDYGNRRVVERSRQNSTKEGKTLISDIDCFGITMDNNGDLYVTDYKKNEVRRWKRGESEGIIVAGGNGKGDQLNQLNYPTYLFVDEDQTLYVSDRDNHRVMKWMKGAKEGVIVAGGQGRGKSFSQLSRPTKVIVDQWDNVFVSDCLNHRIMCWSKGSKEGRVIVGGNGQGQQSNQFNKPAGISFDQHGNLFVVDYSNHRVQKFVVDNQ